MSGQKTVATQQSVDALSRDREKDGVQFTASNDLRSAKPRPGSTSEKVKHRVQGTKSTSADAKDILPMVTSSPPASPRTKRADANDATGFAAVAPPQAGVGVPPLPTHPKAERREHHHNHHQQRRRQENDLCAGQDGSSRSTERAPSKTAGDESVSATGTTAERTEVAAKHLAEHKNEKYQQQGTKLTEPIKDKKQQQQQQQQQNQQPCHKKQTQQPQPENNATDAIAQEQAGKDGGSHKMPSSPAKKKKNKKKKKKKQKLSNADSTQAAAKPVTAEGTHPGQLKQIAYPTAEARSGRPQEPVQGKKRIEKELPQEDGSNGKKKGGKESRDDQPERAKSPSKSTKMKKEPSAKVTKDAGIPKVDPCTSPSEKRTNEKKANEKKSTGKKSTEKKSANTMGNEKGDRAIDAGGGQIENKGAASPTGGSSSGMLREGFCKPHDVVERSEVSSPDGEDEATREGDWAAVGVADDTDDGAWETVEVKPRGRRGKGGGGGRRPGVQQQGGKASAGAGRGRDGDRAEQDGARGDGGTPSHHGRRRNRKYKGRSSHSQHHQQQLNGDQPQSNGQLQQKSMVRDVILKILDAVDDEVARRGGGIAMGGGGPMSEDCRVVPGGFGSRNTGRKHQRGRPVVAAAGGVAPSPSHDPSRLTSGLSAKSLRDILMGSPQLPSSSPTVATTKEEFPITQPRAYGGVEGARERGGAGQTELPSVTKVMSSKVKQGMSYKAMVDPDKPLEPKKEQPRPQHLKPRANAWAKKLSASIKTERPEEATLEQQAQPVTETLPEQLIQTTTAKMTDKATDDSSCRHDSSLVKEVKEKAGTLTGDNKETCEGDPRPQPSISVNFDAGEEEDEGVMVSSHEGPSPPLSTLLGPGITTSCSASSSVASSLEAPRAAGRFRSGGLGGGGNRSGSEDDVGYHLLNVCGQLSSEINAFMGRRAIALDVRRRERNAVLSALGDMLGKIWPGQCRVEMYGSCATQLDLPSSDLDLVVCGLDDVVIDHTHPVGGDQPLLAAPHDAPPPESFCEAEEERGEQAGGGHLGGSPSGSVVDAEERLLPPPLTPDQKRDSFADGDQMMLDGSTGGIVGIDYPPGEVVHENYTSEYHHEPSQEQNIAMESYSPGLFSYHSNQQEAAAGEGYHTPGSYHHTEDATGITEGLRDYQTPIGQDQYYYAPYSYIPALSPNAQRVLRLAAELELQPWAVQVKAIPTATVPVVKMLADPSRLPGLAGAGTGDGNGWMQIRQHVPPPPISPDRGASFFPPGALATQWRGTDIKNGLQPVDVTFEGPEHGGIGSTTFAARVVQDVVDETGVPAESTPVVQVASVLKELLAQRRLNEPFSGGLSSYGLLLLLLAVLKDRRIIQEEMKKVETQRRHVSDGGSCNDGDCCDNDERDGGEQSPQKEQKQQLTNGTFGKGNGQIVSTGSNLLSAPSPGVDSSDKSSAASKPTISSSWASIAKKSNGSTILTESLSTITKSTNESGLAPANKTREVHSSHVGQKKEGKHKAKHGMGQESKQQMLAKKQKDECSQSNFPMAPETIEHLGDTRPMPPLPQSGNVALDGPAVLSQVTPSSEDDVGNVRGTSSSVVPQGSNDVFEVLCSGELTSGKLLMHFLLFYGRHFDAQSTLIDINGTHHPEYGRVDLSRLCPFVARPPGGTIDPITGMFSVDPIVVYDPLEGATDHNVSKRCYCWNNVRWVFAQCYMTVSSIVESDDQRGTAKKGVSATPSGRRDGETDTESCMIATKDNGPGVVDRTDEERRRLPLSPAPILELLLSF